MTRPLLPEFRPCLGNDMHVYEGPPSVATVPALASAHLERISRAVATMDLVRQFLSHGHRIAPLPLGGPVPPG